MEPEISTNIASAIDEDENFYRSLFENAAAGIGRTAWEDGRVLIANQRLAEIFGYADRDEFIREFVFSKRHTEPDGRKRLLEFYETHPGKLAEASFIKRDGSVVHVEAEAKIDPDNRFIDFVLIDVSDRVVARSELQQHRDDLEQLVDQRTEQLRVSEEVFRTFYEVIPDISMITGLEDGIVTSVNQGFLDTTGYLREEVIGQSTLKLDLWRENADRERLVHALKTEGMIGNLEADFRKKDGSYWPGIMAACIIHYNDRPHILSTTVDVSEMRRAQQEAIRASQAKSQFLSSMSHELRTPLHAILGFSQILERDKSLMLDARQKRSFEVIRKSGEHLLQLIDQVLELPRIEAGELEIHLQATDIGTLIQECIEMVEGTTSAHSIQIRDETGGLMLPAVLTDRIRTRQILLNLLSNAIKYNREGGDVVVRSELIDDQQLRISVIDSGTGFSSDEHDRIFEPFDRLDKAGSNIQGVGIGLAISKYLIDAIGGDIGFESEPGKGSHFWINLPLAETENDGDFTSVDSLADQTAEPHTRPIGTQRILYIEDNDINFSLMETLLEDMQGLELLHALNAKGGIEMAGEQRPDLILMDIGLPDMDGIEAARILKSQAETSHIPIIGISAAAMKRDIERAEAAGFYAYKTKPFSIDEFLQTVERALSET